MEKTRMIGWLLERIGSKAKDLQNGYLDDSALEMVGDDIHSYIGILKDLILDLIHPF